MLYVYVLCVLARIRQVRRNFCVYLRASKPSSRIVARILGRSFSLYLCLTISKLVLSVQTRTYTAPHPPVRWHRPVPIH